MADIVAALRPMSGGKTRKVEVTRADPALYGEKWAATGITEVEDWDETAILGAVTLSQGK